MICHLVVIARQQRTAQHASGKCSATKRSELGDLEAKGARGEIDQVARDGGVLEGDGLAREAGATRGDLDAQVAAVAGTAAEDVFDVQLQKKGKDSPARRGSVS